MASKSTRRRQTTTKLPRNSSPVVPTDFEDDDALEDALAYQHGFYNNEDEGSAGGYLSRASGRVRELTREREGRVVIAALAGGFAIGVLIGGVIAASREREQSWTDRLACEGLGRKLLDRLSSAVPDSIAERFSRS